MPHQLSNQTRAHPSAIKSLTAGRCLPAVSCGISSRFQLLSPSEGQVAHVLLTRPPLTWGASSPRPFDLHVLGTPPAFVLSQDQTLKKSYLKRFRLKPFFKCCSPASLKFISVCGTLRTAPTWCVRLASALFNLQGTDARRSAASLTTITWAFPPVKPFSGIFFISFLCHNLWWSSPDSA